MNLIKETGLNVRRMETTQPMETETGEKTPVRVEETRRRVEKMRVEELGQASGVFRNMAGKAREGWDRMKKMLEGKKPIWKGNTGRMVAVSESLVGAMEEVAVDLGEELEGGTVEIVREELGDEEVGLNSAAKVKRVQVGGRDLTSWTTLRLKKGIRNWTQKWVRREREKGVRRRGRKGRVG
jgi:hypothetical protein